MEDKEKGTEVMAEKETKKSSKKPFIIGGILGAIGGAIAGLLLTPWKGSEARAKLKDAANTASEKTKEKATLVKDKIVEKLPKKKEDDEEEAEE